nr:hypothetical protein L203_06239 [Cryptococcus depauperatus CBS 7841]
MSTDHSVACYNGIVLTGSENYATWEPSISESLVLRGLTIAEPVVLGETPTPEEKTEYRRQRQAFALIMQSLSPEVLVFLPANISSFTTASSHALWEHLKSHYSVILVARLAQLFQQMWAPLVIEGEDPNRRMAEIRVAHAQINAGGEKLSDRMLAHAMLLALPSSYTTVKQILYLEESFTSTVVEAAIQAEWTRRTAEGNAVGIKMQGRAAQPFTDHPHTTPTNALCVEIVLRKGYRGRCKLTKVAMATPPAESEGGFASNTTTSIPLVTVALLLIRCIASHGQQGSQQPPAEQLYPLDIMALKGLILDRVLYALDL